jgi:hypothetical protein
VTGLYSSTHSFATCVYTASFICLRQACIEHLNSVCDWPPFSSSLCLLQACINLIISFMVAPCVAPTYRLQQSGMRNFIFFAVFLHSDCTLSLGRPLFKVRIRLWKCLFYSYTICFQNTIMKLLTVSDSSGSYSSSKFCLLETYIYLIMLFTTGLYSV